MTPNIIIIIYSSINNYTIIKIGSWLAPESERRKINNFVKITKMYLLG